MNIKNILHACHAKLLLRRDGFRTIIKSLAGIFLLLFSSFGLSAQGFVFDGKPGEWPALLNNASATTTFVRDANKSNDNQFTQGSKDNLDVNAWAWVIGQTNDKGDISNAGAALLNGVLYFFGDRVAINGDAQIGFWFFHKKVSPLGTTGNGFGPEAHEVGDLLVLSNFTNGGGTVDLRIYKWVGSGGSEGTLDLIGTTGNAKVNTGLEPVPSYTSGTENWTYNPKAGQNGYPQGAFFEGFVNLAGLNIDPCFTNFLLETRNSQSTTASLQDFAADNFDVKPNAVANATPTTDVAVTSAPPHYFLSTTVNGVLNPSGYTYQWSQDPPVGGTLSSTTIPNPTFTATIPGDYKWTVIVTSIATGCKDTADVSRTITPGPGCPTITGGPVCAGAPLTITASAIPANSHYEWSILAPANGAVITSADVTDVTSINVTAGTASFTVKVRVTFDNPALGALENCTAVVTVNPNAAPPSVVMLPVNCASTTFSVQVTNPQLNHRYTVSQPVAGGITPYSIPAAPAFYTSGDVIFNGLVFGKGWRVQAVTDQGCTTDPNVCPAAPAPLVQSAKTVVAAATDVQEPTVLAAPNPFTNKVKFYINVPQSGRGSLELYNMLGQKIGTIYQGYLEKGRSQAFEYNANSSQRGQLIYLFRMGNQKVTGKVIGL